VFKRKAKSGKPAAAPKAKKAKPAKAPKPARKIKAAALGPVKKAPTDIFTVMLMISLAAVIVACAFLLAELCQFGGLKGYPWWKAA
jgi:hypothetical protein